MRVRINLAVIMAAFSFSACAAGANDPVWLRGQLHCHTLLSDGRGFAEQAIDAYKQRGYQFLAITDHNRFADSDSDWHKVEANEGGWPPKVSQPTFDALMELAGKDAVDVKEEGGATYIRMKSYAELKAKYEEPGKFILLPGVEITRTHNGLGMHMNYINVPELIPSIRNAPIVQESRSDTTVSREISKNAAEVQRLAEERLVPYLFVQNHPFWVYCDVVPQNLIDCPEVRFFEICNSGSEFPAYPPAEKYTLEKFWDVVNAFRLAQGQQLLYGIGSDDAHYYDPKRIEGHGGVGEAWIMVRAGALAPESVIEAVDKGDFYATSGVLFEKLEFSKEDKTLRVAVKPQPGVTYAIHFITTKKGFDQTVNQITVPEEHPGPVRTIPLYSDDIGKTMKTVQGTEAEYHLEPDDLYVRARVESNLPSKFQLNFHPKVQSAWTQPYTAD